MVVVPVSVLGLGFRLHCHLVNVVQDAAQAFRQANRLVNVMGREH